MAHGNDGSEARLEHASPGDAAGTSNASAHLAHHFQTSEQQSDAAKLGMWLFLGTEILLFGGLFCLYAVLRGLHPELFLYWGKALDVGWGAINTTVLILSSLTMAIAVWCAQTNHRRGLIVFLGLTLVCAVDFLGIKIIEYQHKFHDNLVWGTSFYDESHDSGATVEETPAVQDAVTLQLDPGDSAAGRDIYRMNCSGCHGQQGQGLPGSGKPLNSSEFIAARSDSDLLTFLQVGRAVNDPLNTTGMAMLPRGGNPRLSDQDLADVVAFLRVLQERLGDRADESRTANAPAPSAGDDPTSVEPSAANQSDPLLITESFVQPGESAPAGLNVKALERMEAQQRWTKGTTIAEGQHDAVRPANSHLFFGIYFLMTGLHGIHVIAGICIVSWLFVRAVRGDFTPDYFTPVDLGGLYWHLVDVIWIFLFPLLYLVH